MITFTCPRCKCRSTGRKYHATCFNEIFREDRILKREQMKKAKRAKKAKDERRAMGVKKKKLVDAERRRVDSELMRKRRTAAVNRGVSPSSYNELEDAELCWSRLMTGRSYG